LEDILGDSGKKVDIFGRNSIGHYEKEIQYCKCLIPIWFNLAFEFVKLLFVGLDLKRNLQKKVGYTRRIARLLLDALELQSALRLTVGFTKNHCKL